ncbi:hypothetical protein IQ256_24250 [cf. Phormidesmis sp. LEGE 11477]|nr:hypothetical protein [cf. Phormidesmis sp. LEGE 11477]
MTPNSDITASSAAGLDGEVNIELVDPFLSPIPVDLPEQTEPDRQVTARCVPAEDTDSLVVTGRGGLPTDPRQMLQGQNVLRDGRQLESAVMSISEPVVSGLAVSELAVSELAVSGPASGSANLASIDLAPVVEAQGWQKDAQGRVQLITPSADPFRAAVDCSTSRSATIN